MDNTPVHSSVREEGVEVMPVSQALDKYDWAADYWWRAVAVDADKYTANIELGQYDGYFIRALPGHKTVFPVQACLYMSQARFKQNVHNIIIAEEGSELHIITGCTTASGTSRASTNCRSSQPTGLYKCSQVKSGTRPPSRSSRRSTSSPSRGPCPCSASSEIGASRLSGSRRPTGGFKSGSTTQATVSFGGSRFSRSGRAQVKMRRIR